MPSCLGSCCNRWSRMQCVTASRIEPIADASLSTRGVTPIHWSSRHGRRTRAHNRRNVAAATNGQSGLGLRITRERLNGMYGDAGRSHVSGNGHGTLRR